MRAMYIQLQENENIYELEILNHKRYIELFTLTVS